MKLLVYNWREFFLLIVVVSVFMAAYVFGPLGGIGGHFLRRTF